MASPAGTSSPRLRRLGESQGMVEYLQEVWRRREFVWNIAAGNLRAQHMDTALGNLWHVINPLLLVGVYFLVFGVFIERASEGVDNFVAFLAVGIFVFNYTQRSVTSGASSIVSNIGLIRSLQFPRAVLPIASVVQSLLAFGSSVVVMFFILMITGERPTVGWLMIVPVTGVVTLFGFGGAFVTSRLTEQVRDIQNVLPYIFRLLFYMSGIIYSVDSVIDDPTLRFLFLFNPFYDIVEITRHYVMSTYEVANIGSMWLALACITAVTLLVGLIYFRSGEGSYGRG